jgi:hypothetical protein
VSFACWKSAIRKPEVDIKAKLHHLLQVHGSNVRCAVCCALTA